METEAETIIQVYATDDGVKINTNGGISAGNCSALLAGIALNFEHSSGKDAAQLLRRAAERVEELRAIQQIGAAS